MKTAFLRLTVALAAAVVPLMAIAQESGVTISVDSGAFVFSPAGEACTRTRARTPPLRPGSSHN